VTPSAVASTHCSTEFELFLAREAELGRKDLIFPILYIRVPALGIEEDRRRNDVLEIIHARQYANWTKVRLLDVASFEVGKQIADFCQDIVETLRKPWVSPEERRRQEEAEARERAENERRQQEAEAQRRAENEARRKKDEAEVQRLAEERRQQEAEAKRRADEAERQKQAQAEARERAEEERRAGEAEAKQRADQGRAFAKVKRADVVSAVDEFLAAYPAADYDEVHLGAVTPHTVFLGEPFVARFACYTDTTRAIISEIIESEAPGSHIRLGLDRSRWHRNTEVTVRLEANNARVANHVQTFRWDGSYKILRYDITVLDNISDNRLILKFDVFVEGLLIISLRPETKVQRNANTNATPLSRVETPAPRTAFASYVKTDRREVLGRIRSVQIATGMDVFLDCLSIQPGEQWKPKLREEIASRNIFWLFWSRDAMKSEWVDWEWRTALASKSIAGIQPHPLEPADLAPAPKELSELQFGAMYEWYILHLRKSWFRSFWHRAWRRNWPMSGFRRWEKLFLRGLIRV
jgi:hypothetical protein